eukprot:2911427-Prymnesium_polylepis.1
MANQRGKGLVNFAKFTRDYLMRQHGQKLVADKALCDLRHSVETYAGGEAQLAWQSRFGIVNGMMTNWNDHKIDFCLSFLGRSISLDRNNEEQLTSSGSGASSGRSVVVSIGNFKGEGAEWLGRSVPAPLNMRDMLLKESLKIKLSAAEVCVDLFVVGKELAVSIKAQLRELAEEQPYEGEPSSVLQLNIDIMIEAVMQEWQRVDDEREANHIRALNEMVDDLDRNGDGLLDFGEFRQLLERDANQSGSLNVDMMVNMFDNAIQLSSEERDEEMSAMTRQAFITTAMQNGLLMKVDSTFVDPATLHQSVQPDDNPKAKQKRSLFGMAKESGEAREELKSPEAVEMIKIALGSNFLFKDLEDGAIEEAVLFMTEEQVSEGTTVIQQGTKGEFLCVCQSGVFDVLVNGVQVH